jgi:serine/threonine protein kinase
MAAQAIARACAAGVAAGLMLCVPCAASMLTAWQTPDLSSLPYQIIRSSPDGHLNIVHAEEVVLSRTHVGLVMEFVQGEPLGQSRAEEDAAAGQLTGSELGVGADHPRPPFSINHYAGGNMVGYVTKHRETRESRGGLCLDEDECNYYFRQLIWAVQFCHENHVAHRCGPRRGGFVQKA